MYHPGKVITIIRNSSKEVVSSDKSTQAILAMWDDNQLTFDVAPTIASGLKPGDLVLVDYTPVARGSSLAPRHLVVKILKGKTGESVWKAYAAYHGKRHGRASPPTAEPNGKPHVEENTPRYFG